MRAALIAFALCATMSMVSGDVCPAPVAPVATPTPTPYPSLVQPAGLCPSACRGWGSSFNSALNWFTANTVPVDSSIAGLSDTSNVLMTSVAPADDANQWPMQSLTTAGVYGLNYYAQDVCGRTAMSTGTLDLRCNNPPKPLVKSGTTQSFTVQLGQEILIDGSDSFDPDSADIVTFQWCLMSQPVPSGGQVTPTTYDVGQWMRVADVTNYPGYLLLAPRYSGAYVINLVVSDGCNFISQTITVNVVVNCCQHTAVASGVNSVTWTDTASNTMSTQIGSWETTNSSCLPPDYVIDNPNNFYKSRYSPVISDMQGNSVVLSSDELPFISGAGGCTWPGASNFAPTASFDDGSCTCGLNSNNWDVAPNMYMRRADRQMTTPTIKTAGQLEFVTSVGSTTTLPTTSCPFTWSPAAMLANTTSEDIRFDTTNGMITNTSPLLPRPSTSWDATMSYSVTNQTMWSYGNMNTTTRVVPNGPAICTVSVNPAASTSNVNTVTVTAASGYTYQQCLGYYTLMLNSTSAQSNSNCRLSQDMLEVAVVCPYPPFVNILADVNMLLWDGTKFVSEPSVSPTTTAETNANWVQIDARETPYMSSVTYTLSATQMPPANTFLGAGPDGPAAGRNDLNPYVNTTSVIIDATATGTNQKIAAAFLPTRGGTCSNSGNVRTATCTAGTYKVTMMGSDTCNSPSSDTVTINTMCLPIQNLATVVPAAVLANQFPVTININGSYALGATGNLNTGLNYGIRVNSRPMLPMGDYGMNSEGSFECMTGQGWKTQWTTPATAPNQVFSTAQTVTATAQFIGSYTFAVTVLDACSQSTVTFPVTTASCGASTSSVNVPVSTTLTSTWTNKAFPFVTLPAPTGTAPAGAVFSWFLTNAPAGVTKYVTPTAMNATQVMCQGYNTVWQSPSTSVVQGGGSSQGIGGLSALRKANFPTDPSSPVVTLTSQSTQALTAPQMASLFPVIGSGNSQYTMSLQTTGVCDATVASNTVAINLQCNNPARFLCLSNTGAGGAVACPATTTLANNPNGLSMTTSAWSCAVQRYAPVFVTSLVDAGQETVASSDDLNIQVTFSQLPVTNAATPLKESWWTAAYFIETVTFSFVIPDDTNDIFDDQNGFVTLSTAVDAAFTTAMNAGANLNLNANRFFTSTASLNSAISSYANQATTALGTKITGACYTAGWGRNFTASVTFAILPPTYFRAFGNVGANAVSTAATPDARGYARTLPTAGAATYAPLGQWRMYLTSALPTIVMSTVSTVAAAYTASATLPTGYVSSVGGNMFTQMIMPPVANNILFRGFAANLGQTAAQITTSFVPDVDGTYAVQTTVWDDCPAAVYNSWTNQTTPAFSLPIATLNSVTVSAPSSCMNPASTQLTISQYDDNTVGSASVAISRMWTNSSAKFVADWYYSGRLTTGYNMNSALGFTASCFNADGTSCSTGPSVNVGSGTTGPTIVFQSNQYASAFATATLPALTGGTLQFTLSNPGSGTAAVVPGGELLVGCVNSFSTSTLSSISFFYSFDTAAFAAASTVNLLLPAACSAGSTTLVFAQFSSLTTMPAWSISNLQLFQHPAGFLNVAASCGIAYAYNFNPIYTPALNTTGAGITAQFVGQPQVVKTMSTGYSGNLPSNTVTLAPSYSLAFTMPAWVWSLPAQCAATSAVLTTPATLTCPVSTPTAAVTYRTAAATSVAFDSVAHHFNPVYVAVSGIGSTILYSDMSFLFEVTNAPFGSVLNKVFLADQVITPRLMSENPNLRYTGRNLATGAPIFSNVMSQCFTKNQSPLFTYANWSSSAVHMSTINSTYAAYVDDSLINVMLKSQGTGPNPAWIATPGSNAALPNYSEFINGIASFIPDVSNAGTTGQAYTVKVSVNDQCNPVSVSNVNIMTDACPTVTAAITSTPAAPAITTSGAGRVQLSGSIAVGGTTFNWNEDAGALNVMWTVTGPAMNGSSVTMPVPVDDMQSLYPSFVPTVAGTYTVSMAVNWNCWNAGTRTNNVRVMPASYTATSSITVACGTTAQPVASPNPQAILAQTNSGTINARRTAPNGNLVFPLNTVYPGGYMPNKDVFYWIGQPGCPAARSWWAPVSTTTYTCPSSYYTVGVQSVYPPVLLTGIDQLVQVTVTVNGMAMIPSGLMNSMYRSGAQDSFVAEIMINQQVCSNPYVVDASRGRIVCRSGVFNSAASAPGVRVSARLDGVLSTDMELDAFVVISDSPVILSVFGMPSSNGSAPGPIPTVGGTRIIISGYNLAFAQTANTWDPYVSTQATTNNWSPYDTTVMVRLGQGSPSMFPCTGIQGYGAEVLFTSQMSISCIVPPGYGRFQTVAVMTGFRQPMPNSQSNFRRYVTPVGTANVLSYDAPMVTGIAGDQKSSLGGYWANLTVVNLGAQVLGTPFGEFDDESSSPYSDLMFSIGWHYPVPRFHVRSDEAVGSPAQVYIQVPPGCGANLPVMVYRANTQTMGPASSQMAFFSYAPPMVTCIGQPFVDSTSAGCARIYVDGQNFGAATNGSMVVVRVVGPNNADHGVCDDVQYVAGSDYVRFSCRLPSAAIGGDKIIVTNECGVSSALSAATIPTSIILANQLSNFAVGKSVEYNSAVQAPIQPATSIRQESEITVIIKQGGTWGDRVLSNGLFIGLVLPLLIIFIVGYVLWVRMDAGKSRAGGSGRVGTGPAMFAPAAARTVASAPAQTTM